MEGVALGLGLGEFDYVLVKGLFFVSQGRIYVIVAAEPGVVGELFFEAFEPIGVFVHRVKLQAIRNVVERAFR